MAIGPYISDFRMGAKLIELAIRELRQLCKFQYRWRKNRKPKSESPEGIASDWQMTIKNCNQRAVL